MTAPESNNLPVAKSPAPIASAPPVGGLVFRAMFGGALMGLANLVPGISGGTMLLATGVYPQFVNGIAELSTFRFRRRSIILLACIIGSALLAIVLLAGVVKNLVVDHRWIMYALFIGLTLGGVPVLWRMVRPMSSVVVVMSVVGIAVMALLLLVDPSSAGAQSEGHPYLMYFLAGLAGASAMVLPGVSGGYLLLILGQYVAILTAIDQLRSGASARDMSIIMESMHVVVPVGIGVLVGVVGVSNLVKILLEKFERATLGFLLGLLLGAVLGLWPFQRGVAPEVGTTFKGDTVIERGGALVMETTGKMIEAADYELAIYTPQWWQVAAAIGIVIAGFAISTVIAMVGPQAEAADG